MKSGLSYSSLNMAEIVNDSLTNENRLESPLTTLASRLAFSNLSTPTTAEPHPNINIEIQDYDVPMHEISSMSKSKNELDSPTDDKDKEEEEEEEKGPVDCSICTIIVRTVDWVRRVFSNNIKANHKQRRGRQKVLPAQVIDFDVKCESPIKSEEDQSLNVSDFNTKLTSECHSSALNLGNNSDEIELFGSSHETINNNSDCSVKEDIQSQITHDSVYSSPKSPLFSDNDLLEILKCDKPDTDDIECMERDLSFNFDEMTPDRKQSSPVIRDIGDDHVDISDSVKELLFKDIKSESIGTKRSARKRLNMDAVATTPDIEKVKNNSLRCLITTPERVCFGNITNNLLPVTRPVSALKRLEPETSPNKSAKKFKCEDEVPKLAERAFPPICHQQLQQVKRPFLRKSMSVDEAAMMFNDKNKTADFCYELCLPILGTSKHSDLKSITPETLKRVMSGEYDHAIASYKIIDCRFPYEFEGGHIRGAANLYMENQINDEFMKLQNEIPHVDTDGKRNIIIFHCEFSSERGPRQYRHLRNIDRAANTYPTLQYPEIYLLEGGYKAFYEKFKDYCEPQAYRLMVDPEFNVQYQAFRAKTRRSGLFGGEASTRRLMKTRSRLAL